MAERWLADTTTDKLLYYTENDDLVVADTVARLVSLIRTYDPPGADGRIQAQGTFNIADGYKPPADQGYLAPFDTSTDLGRKQVSAQELHDWLHSVTASIHAVRHEKPIVDTAALEQFVTAAHWVNYVVAHMTSIDAAEFKAWAEAMMEWPENVTGTTHADRIQKLYEEAHDLDAAVIPTVAAGWVDPADPTDITTIPEVVSQSTGWLTGETTDLTNINLGNGAWIRRLPAA